MSFACGKTATLKGILLIVEQFERMKNQEHDSKIETFSIPTNFIAQVKNGKNEKLERKSKPKIDDIINDSNWRDYFDNASDEISLISDSYDTELSQPIDNIGIAAAAAAANKVTDFNSTLPTKPTITTSTIMMSTEIVNVDDSETMTWKIISIVFILLASILLIATICLWPRVKLRWNS